LSAKDYSSFSGSGYEAFLNIFSGGGASTCEKFANMLLYSSFLMTSGSPGMGGGGTSLGNGFKKPPFPKGLDAAWIS
jgi:hypothetical protein